MPDAVLAVLYAVILMLGLTAGITHLGRRGVPRPHLARSSVALWLLVAIPSVLQFLFPALLSALRRDPELIRDGQAWRLLTSAVVQDGGAIGTVFNLVALALVVLVAGEVWGGRRMWILFLASQLVSNSLVVITFAPAGAGNSIATFGLGMSMVSVVVAHDRRPADVGRLVLSMGLAIALLADRDIHGIAVCVGLVLGLACAAVWPNPRTP